jgi:hypothetical protein
MLHFSGMYAGKSVRKRGGYTLLPDEGGDGIGAKIPRIIVTIYENLTTHL